MLHVKKFDEMMVTYQKGETFMREMTLCPEIN